MRRFSFFTILSLVAVFCASTSLFAQSQIVDKFLISAKAGGVNHVEGSVTIMRSTGTAGVLLKRDRVEIGDRVTTGADGRAEILLNPGSYIRLAANSSFEFGTTDLEDLKLNLDSGTAIFEVFAADEFRVSVSTPKGKIALVDTGVYRVDVSPNGSALLSVVKGKAEIGEGNATLVKEGRTGTVDGGTVAVAKFDKGKRDNFANWSRDRAKELAKVSSSLQDRQLNRAILAGFNNRSWNIYGSFGLWVYDAAFGGHCFVPFGYGWRSPYGSWYHNYIYWPYFYNPVYPPVSGGGGIVPPTTRKVSSRVQQTGPGNDGSTKISNGTTRTIYEPPPFTKVGRGGVTNDGGGMVNTKSDFDLSGSGRSNSGSIPSFSPPVSSPPISVSPSSGKSSSRVDQ